LKKLVLCTCNKTLNKKLDFPKIEKEVSSLFDEIKIVDALCLEEGLKALSEFANDDDQIVIGACSSQIIGVPVSKKLNNDHIAYVPIREHVAWVHPDELESASSKAIVLLTDGNTWLEYAVEKTKVEEDVLGSVLVIGGGVAALKAASDLLKLGIGVTIAKPIDWDEAKYRSASRFMAEEGDITSTIKELEKSAKNAKFINCDIIELDGYLGKYKITVRKEDGKEDVVLCGAIIIAVEPGIDLPPIAKICHYGNSDKTIIITDLPNVVSETPKNKQMAILVAIDPNINLTRAEGNYLLRASTQAAECGHSVFVVHQDIRTDDENLYRRAREAGVLFIRGAIYKTQETDDGISCIIENLLESMKREIMVDLLVIQTTVTPWKGLSALANNLGVKLDVDGFVKTRYSKMKPVHTSRRGVFLAGNSKMPMGLSETLTSAGNSALEAFKIVRSNVTRRGWIPVIDEEKCDVCKACLDACPNDALRLVEDKIQHIPVHCEFCGICVTSCPTRAIEFQSYGKESWFARLETISKTHKRLFGETPFTLVYACSECANASIDQAGFTGKTYPVGTYVLQFPCAGMVSPIEILKGLAEGAEKVIVAHCPSGGCHHQTGDHMAELVVKFTRDMLKEIGQDPERVRSTFMIAALPNKMQEEVA
jgi:heterodisulfide reductase subunit A-like polyferredoxin/coenzyme F420-reducing hydrogenase delta subunit